MRRIVLAVLCATAVAAPMSTAAREIRAVDMTVNGNFAIEAAVTGLDAPTMVAFDDQGRMLVAESGYGGSGTPKVSRIAVDGSKEVLAEGEQLENPLTSVAFHEGVIWVVTAGTVWQLAEDGALTAVITGLPGLGDHQANQLAFHEGQLYLSIGTVTNSAVVGVDNAVFGWLEMPERRDLHDVPCQDVVVTGAAFESDDPLGSAQTVRTSAYAPFGTVLESGTTVPGDPKCNGAILRANLDGSGLEVVAWGLRNPYGLEVGPDGALYATMHGFDARGSRPVEDAADCLYRIEAGAWYGWPDFACDEPVTDPRFRPVNQPQPQFLLAGHPDDTPPAPIAKFAPHAAINGFAFAPSAEWGQATDAFVALFGDFTPATGTVPAPQGVKVVRVDTTTGELSDFISNDIAGEASKHGLGGLEHPSDVTFGPDGAMYVTDWGLARISVDGLKLEPDSGVVWRVVSSAAPGESILGSSVLINLLTIVLLIASAVILVAGRGPSRSFVRGAASGLIAGGLMGAFAMFVVSPILELPWYATPRVLATIPLGRSAVANILEFDLASFIVGIGVLLVLTGGLGALFALLTRTRSPWKVALSGALFGLGTWAALQSFLLPALFPLVSDKGLPPLWLAAAFLLYGIALGILTSVARRDGREVTAA